MSDPLEPADPPGDPLDEGDQTPEDSEAGAGEEHPPEAADG